MNPRPQPFRGERLNPVVNKLRADRVRLKWHAEHRAQRGSKGFGFMLRILSKNAEYDRFGIGNRAYWIIMREGWPARENMHPKKRINVARERIYAAMDLPF